MRVRTPRDMGILIREARVSRGLSQSALAKQINTTQTWISWIENGKPTAEIGSVLLALSTLGLEINIDRPMSTPAADNPADDDAPPYQL